MIIHYTNVIDKRNVPLEQEGPVYPGAQLHDPGAVQDPPFSHAGEHMALWKTNINIPKNYIKQNHLIFFTKL